MLYTQALYRLKELKRRDGHFGCVGDDLYVHAMCIFVCAYIHMACTYT
jgi:hypothetical protein